MNGLTYLISDPPSIQAVINSFMALLRAALWKRAVVIMATRRVHHLFDLVIFGGGCCCC